MNKTREQIIHSMCGTWRHDYGLMDEQSKNQLFSSMAQIFDNDIAYNLMMQSDVDNYEEEAEKLQEDIRSLEQQNAELQARIKELEANEEKLKREWYIIGSNDNYQALLKSGKLRQ